MAKFIYRMQNILDLKERLETQAKTEYSEMTARLNIEEDAMRRLVARLRGYEEQLKEASLGAIDLSNVRRCNDAIKITKDLITAQAVRIRIAQKNVDLAMEKLTEAVQDRKVQEKLKEKAFEDFKMELNAQESKEIDELVSFNYNNREV